MVPTTLINRIEDNPFLMELSSLFNDNQFSFYLVGGAVRDFILDIDTKDFDSEVVLGIVHVLNKNFPHGSIRTALGAFYNHSDNPNCKNVAGFWHQLPVKYLITTKPIKKGEELTAAYTLYKDFSDKWE